MIRSLIAAVALLAAFFLISTIGSAGRSAARPGVRSGVVHPHPARPGVIPDALPVQLSGGQLTTAARRCAAWAAKAGFPNTGQAHGRLTTAVAIALAETGCDPAACYDNSTHQACTAASSQHTSDSVYRGAWLVGGQTRTGVSDTCADQGRCNARAAYRQVAGFGSDFRPWTAYQAGGYQRFLTAAAKAVGLLRQGALPSGVTGLCAEYVVDEPGAWAGLARCGRGAPEGQWTLSGEEVRTTSGLCLTVTPATNATTTPAATTTAAESPVVVERCTGSKFQDWLSGTGFSLNNVGAKRCLTAPGPRAQPGTTLTVQLCAQSRQQRWFRP